MDLLDPSQRNLQVNSKTPFVLIAFLVLSNFGLELIFCFLSRFEKMSNLVSMLKILQRSLCLQLRM